MFKLSDRFYLHLKFMDLKFDGIRECLNHWVFELPNVDCICLYLLYMILEHAIGITDIN